MGQTKKLIQFWEMVSNYNVNSSYTYKELKKCKNKWILCQKSKIYNKTFKILSIGKVFIKSTNSKMIFFISKIPLKLLDWFRIWKTCVNHTLAHREIFNKNCDSSIPQNKKKSAQLLNIMSSLREHIQLTWKINIPISRRHTVYREISAYFYDCSIHLWDCKQWANF